MLVVVMLRGLRRTLVGSVFRLSLGSMHPARPDDFWTATRSLNSQMKSLTFLFVCVLSLSALGADKNEATSIPDLTLGGSIPANAKHDWNLGPTGLRGWMFCDRLVTSDARQIAITKVDPSSPADGSILVGDVLLGVNGRLFSKDPRTEFGEALTFAESAEGNGQIRLTVWRSGKTSDVVLNLPVMGRYSLMAPFECRKSASILERGCNHIANRMRETSYANQEPIVRSLNALALLANSDPEHLSLIKAEADWAAGFASSSMQTWRYGYVMMFLCEYIDATGDRSVLPGLRRLAMEAALGQSAVGSWGHGFAKQDGRLGGYGMMNSPGLPLTIALVLARKTGVSDPAIDLAIERSARLLGFYTGKGAIPYGDHHPWIENHEDNGKCGMASVLFSLLGNRDGAEFFSRMSLASHGSERDTGHTGNFFNLLWAMPGIALSGNHATGEWMQEFGAWYFDLARRWDGSFSHQGPPENGKDSYASWDCTGAYLLAYAMPLKKLRLTGKEGSVARQMDAQEARAIVRDGRGWTNKDRNGFYDSLNESELLARIESWSPIVRERTAAALARRKELPLQAITQRLHHDRLEARYGACQAIIALKGRGELAVDELIPLLSHGDLWLRIKAAEALAAIGNGAMRAVPRLLELLAQQDAEKDPRGMQQRYLSFALFDRGGMLNRSLAGVDREALRNAIRAGLKNQDGRARGSIGSAYRQLSLDDIRPLLPSIHEAIVTPAPSGEMFADTVRVEGLRLLAQHHIEEGMLALVRYTRDQNPWASQKRTPELMKILLQYGSHAKRVIPDLEKVAHYFEKEEKDFPPNLKIEKANCLRSTIAEIESSTDKPNLISFEAK